MFFQLEKERKCNKELIKNVFFTKHRENILSLHKLAIHQKYYFTPGVVRTLSLNSKHTFIQSNPILPDNLIKEEI